MVYRGSVLKVEENHIVVFTNDCQYKKLKKKGNIEVGKEIIFIDEDIIKDKNKSYTYLASIAAAIILLIVTTLGMFNIDILGRYVTYAVVSLDINPSVEFEINKNEIVKNIRPLNEDGKEIVDDSMIGMKIEEAVYLSINNAKEKEYLNEENNVVLISNVVLKNKEKNSIDVKEKLAEIIEDNKELENIGIIYVEPKKEDLKEARKNEVSAGKYEIYKLISKDNSSITIEEIKTKKISEIVKENKEIVKNKNVKVKKHKKDKEEIKQENVERKETKLKKQEEKNNKKQEKNSLKEEKKENKKIEKNLKIQEKNNKKKEDNDTIKKDKTKDENNPNNKEKNEKVIRKEKNNKEKESISNGKVESDEKKGKSNEEKKEDNEKKTNDNIEKRGKKEKEEKGKKDDSSKNKKEDKDTQKKPNKRK